MKKNKKHQPIDPASLAPKATAGNITLHSRTIGALPIINHFMERCRLREKNAQPPMGIACCGFTPWARRFRMTPGG